MVFYIFFTGFIWPCIPPAWKQTTVYNKRKGSDLLFIKRLAPNSIIVEYHVILILSPSISAA